MNAPLEERARDVHAAFADPEIKAIICSIDGDDQIKLLKYLDFGHTDPQCIIPNEGWMRVDGIEKKIFARY